MPQKFTSKALLDITAVQMSHYLTRDDVRRSRPLPLCEYFACTAEICSSDTSGCRYFFIVFFKHSSSVCPQNNRHISIPYIGIAHCLVVINVKGEWKQIYSPLCPVGIPRYDYRCVVGQKMFYHPNAFASVQKSTLITQIC